MPDTPPSSPDADVVRPASSQDLRDRADRLRNRRRRFMRATLAVAAACLLLAAWIAARLAASGLPGAWEQRISDALSSDDWAVEVEGISFSLPRMRLRVDSANVYPRGVIRRAAVSAAGASLLVKPRAMIPNIDWLREIRIESLEIDAEALANAPESEDSEPVEVPDFPPVRLFVRRLSGLGIDAHHVNADLSARNGVLAVEGASAAFHNRGEKTQILRGRVTVDPNGPEVVASGSGALSFAKIVPPLVQLDCPGLAEELSVFDFPDAPPSISASLRWAPQLGIRTLRLAIQSGPMRYREVQLSGFSGVVRVGGDGAWNDVLLKPLEIRRPEGGVSGSLSVDVAADTMGFDYVCTMDPLRFAALAGLVEPDFAPEMSFETPTEIRCAGTLGLGENGSSNTAIRLSASIPGMTVRGFRFSELSTSGGFVGDVLDLPEISARAMDGSLRASFRLDTGKDNPNAEDMVSATLDIRGVPQARWAGLIGQEADAKAGGTLDLSAAFDGPFSELGADVPRRGRGSVALDVRESNLFRIPLFAGLTDILANFIPGVDFLVDQNEAHVRATLDNGRWNLSRMVVSGAAFSIDGSGSAASDGTELDIVARVRLMNDKSWFGRRVHDFLRPLSGLFGIHAKGSLSSPRWSVAPFSKSSAK